ncbi:DUF3742 family protein [Robbsia andropogonis]
MRHIDGRREIRRALHDYCHSPPTLSSASRPGRRSCGRWYVHREQQLIRTLIAQGISARAARTALWVVKFAVLGLLLYLAFWPACCRVH